MSDVLAVSGLDAFYGDSQVLFDVSIDVGEDELVGVFGRNGMGKTTLLRCIVNSVDRKRGTVTFRGEDISGEPTHGIVRSGIAYVPEERNIYPALTVRENLELAAPRDISREERERRIEDLLTRFERLTDRADQRGGTLSGGEQQMLAIARGLITRPDLLLLDEPTEGLAPIVIEEVVEILTELAEQNRSVVLVEQNVSRTLPIIDRGYVLENGEVVVEGDPDRLAEDEVQDQYLTV